MNWGKPHSHKRDRYLLVVVVVVVVVVLLLLLLLLLLLAAAAAAVAVAVAETTHMTCERFARLELHCVLSGLPSNDSVWSLLKCHLG